ncbi:MAG: restriction endonuclease [Thermoguttaceae bacterium]
MADKISLDRIDEIIRIVFQQLKTMGGHGKPKEVLAAVEPKLNLTDYEKGTTKTGAVRWNTHIRFYTTDCVKAGFLVKSDGQWSLTEKGEKALKMPPGQLVRTASREYRATREAQDQEGVAEVVAGTEENVERQAVYEEARERAHYEIEEYINNMLPYDFQDLVAELLRAMGYYISFVAPRGPDGGRDVVAYKDPLGTTSPRIYVQVKHRDQKVDVKEVQQLVGTLHKEGDIGLFVSSGGFSAVAEREIQSSNKHIEKIDLDRLIKLWQQHYEHISETGKALLPLVQVHFLKPSQE